MKFPADKFTITAASLLLLIFFFAAGISFQKSIEADSNAALVNHTQLVLTETDHLKSGIIEIQNDVRGFLLTGQSAFVSDSALVNKTVLDEINHLQQLTADNNTQQSNIARIEENTFKLTYFLDSLVETRRKKGLEAAAGLMGTLREYNYANNIIQLLAEIQKEENRLLQLRKAKNEHSILILKRMLFSIIAAGLILTFILLKNVWEHQKKLKHAAEKLRESEERNRLIINNAKDYAIFMMDKDGYILSWNEGVQEIKGYTDEEIIGKHISMFYTERDRNLGEPARNLALATKNKRLEKEGWRVRKDGSLFRAHVIFTALYDDRGQLRGFSKITRDITQATKDQEKIAYLARLMEDVSDAVFSSDHNLTIKAWNKAAEKLYGFKAPDVIGKSASAIIRPQLDDVTRKQIREKLNVDGYWSGEVIHLKNDGTPLILFISNSVTRNAEGLIDGYVSVCRDISESKKLEEQLKTFNRELENQVRQKTIELTNIFERVTDAFIALDKYLRYTYVSKKAAALVHREPASLIGKYIWDEFPQAVGSETYHAIMKAMKEQQYVSNTDHYKPLNLWQENYIYPSPEGLSIFIRDTTLSKRAEVDLAAAHERLLFHIEKSPLGFIEWDNRFKPRFWSKQAENILGYTKEDMEVLEEKGNSLVYEEDRARAQKIAGQLITGEIDFSNLVLRNNTKDGRVIWCEWFTSVLKDKKGEVLSLLTLVQDITSRKKQEDELMKERSLLRTLIDNLPDYIYVKDTELRHIINNMANVRLLGAASEKETLGKTVLDYFPKKIAEKYIADDTVVITTNTPIYNREEPIYNQSGERRWLLTTKIPLTGNDNQNIGLIGISRDITDIKNTAAQVLKEKELSDSIINNLPGIFYMYNEMGNLVRWNRNFETVTGYNEKEIPVMNPLDFYVPEERERIDHRIKTSFNENLPGTETMFVSREGQRTPYFINSWSINLANSRYIIGTGIDLTERHKASEALRQSERKYKLLFESNPMPMWMVSLNDYRIIDVNESATRHYGYSKEEFLSINILKMRPAEDQVKLMQELQRHLPGISNRGIWRHKKKDGTIIHIEAHAYDFMYEGEKTRLLLANDITEKIKAEEKLQQSYLEIRQLASHLQEIREEERADMAREIHDVLGQEITGLKMDISWLSKKITSEDREVKQKIKEILELLDGTVKTVRKISTELRPSILDDLGIIEAMKWQSIEFQKRYSIRVKFISDFEDLPIPNNIRIAIFRIYQESLTNVARHAKGATQVESKLLKKEGGFELVITDNGSGFDVAESRDKKTLGLLGMRERTQMIGGNYVLSSTPGSGTTVSVYVPYK